MSAKIGILEAHQNLTESPSRRVKKAIALYLVRQAIAEWVNKAMIRLRPLRDFSIARELPIITYAEQFDYDYPAYLFADIPKRDFWHEALLLTYPLKDLRSGVYR